MFKGMEPRSIVAVVLSITVMIFVLLGVIRSLIYPETASLQGAEMWADLMKVIIGGLIGYIASGNK